MIGYIYDDGGRSKAGYKGSTGDCVARATSILTERPYKEVYKTIANINKSAGRPRSARNGLKWSLCNKFFQSVGLKKVKLPKTGARPTYSDAYDKYGDCIVTTNRHVSAIVDGNLRDTFDDRTYAWDVNNIPVIRERKARSIWIKE